VSLSFLLSLWLTNLHVRFGSLYDAGDDSVRNQIVRFAAGKLLNVDVNDSTTEELSDDQRLACLSQRIPIEFNSTTYVAQASERKQVEGHMRVCLKIDAGFESMVTISASEPILSEAAYSIMTRESFDVLKVVKISFEGFAIRQGDRGEYLITVLFTMSRDATVGLPNNDGRPCSGTRIFALARFVAKELFNNPKSLQSLYEDFPDAKMHFNHYIKVHQHKSITAERLLLLSARGAAVLCGHSQEGIDGINPFLCNGTELSRANLGLILWQAKNDQSYTNTVQQKYFNNMDPYYLGILEEGDDAVPIIKIIFALASSTPGLHVKRHAPSADYGACVYEIWCAGLVPQNLAPVTSTNNNLWTALLNASHGWEQIYKGENSDLKKSMNPGAATDLAHWNGWVC